MGYHVITVVAFTILLALPDTSFAIPVDPVFSDTRTSLAGDIDGLGLGLQPGEAFNFSDIPTYRPAEAPEGIFDAWIGGPNMPEVSWTQPGFAGAKILDAFCVIGSGGWGGYYGPATLLIEGEEVGMLQTANVENSYLLNVFDLTPFVHLLQQPEINFSFVTPHLSLSPNGTLQEWFDSGALDFSEIHVVTQPSGTPPSSVPEPCPALLLATGLLVLLWRHRNFRRQG